MSLEICRSEGIGLIGGNGSGKSTLLRLLAGIYRPTEGDCVVARHLAPVLELGTGFHRELSGRDNLMVFAAALGLTRDEIHSSIDQIIDFTRLRDVIGRPLKQYSSGMQARLALSVALCGRFDCLLLDEALSVCDRSFGDEVEEKLFELRNQGGAYVLVSHDLEQIRRLCTRVLWMRDGRIEADGDAIDVINAYRLASDD